MPTFGTTLTNLAVTDIDAVAVAQATPSSTAFPTASSSSAVASATNLAPVTQMNSYSDEFIAFDDAGLGSIKDATMPLPMVGAPALGLLSGLLTGGAPTYDRLTDTSAPAMMAPNTIMDDMFPNAVPRNCRRSKHLNQPGTSLLADILEQIHESWCERSEVAGR